MKLVAPKCRSAGLLLLLSSLVAAATPAGVPPPTAPADPAQLKTLSLEELSQIEVTSPSKEPVSAFRSPVAIYVIPGDEIRRSGATSLPEALWWSLY